MAYTKPYTLDPTSGGDTVKGAIVDKVDRNADQIVADLNTHEALTTAAHGLTAGQGAIVGAAQLATLTRKTLSAPTLTGAIDASGATITSPTITGGARTNGTFTTPTIVTPTITGTITLTNAILSGGTISAPTLTGSIDATGATISMGTLSGGTLATNTISAPTITGAVTATGATVSGGTFSSPTLSAPTITGAVTATGATISVGTITGGSHINGTIQAPTITGSVTSTGATFNQIPVNAAPGEHTASGLTVSLTYGAQVTMYDLLRMGAAGKLVLANASATTTLPAQFLCLTNGVTDAVNAVLKTGIAQDASWSFTAGNLLYLSALTAGRITETRPATSTNQVQFIGEALSATVIHFNPCYAYVEVS